MITEQTIAGAISTATHGSGRHSMSHYMAEIRAAAYDAQTGQARVFVWNDGPALWAARCALGCMGIILTVKLRCIPQYAVAENVRRHDSLNEVLAQEAEHPLQQFYLVPHAWVDYAQQVMNRTTEATESLLKCHSFNDMLAVQAELMCGHLQAFLDQSTKLAEITNRMAARSIDAIGKAARRESADKNRR